MAAKAEAGSGRRNYNVRFLIESVLLTALITGAIVAAFTYIKPLESIERLLDDVGVAYTTPAKEKHSKVVVVAIDDATIEQLPWRSPINRKFLAKLLAALDKGKPKAIGVDVIIFEPSYDPADDAALAGVLANLQSPIVLATELLDEGRRLLVPSIEGSGIDVALANLPVDKDDRTLRKFKTAFADQKGVLHDTMAAVLARHAGAEVESDATERFIDWYGQPGWQNRRIEGEGDQFAGPNPIATFPASTLMKLPPPVLSKLLGGKVVLVGATFSGSHDFLRTPFALRGAGEESFPGVYGHAMVVAQLLDRRSRQVLGPGVDILLVLFAVSVGMLLALMRVPAIIPLILAAGLPVAWIAGVFYLRKETGLIVPSAPPALGVGLSLSIFALFRARRFDQSQRVAAKALNSYLPPALARRVVDQPDLLKLGGEPRELSILFTDIAGFTRYSEHAEPGEVVQLLNAYLNRMAEIVLANDGTLDKFIGDAVMAFFGAPVPVPNHSALALSCALDMDKFAREFAKEHGLKTRIGVHTGTVIVGNIGGERRFDYTVIGDAVNTAARLEAANKYFGEDKKKPATTVCVSDDTVRHFRGLGPGDNQSELTRINLTGDEMRDHPDAPSLRRIGKVKVSGREQPLDVFTTTPPDFRPEDLDNYNQALELLESGQHDDAGKILQPLYNEKLSAFQLARCVNRDDPILTLTEK